jgi:hypothetical protein
MEHMLQETPAAVLAVLMYGSYQSWWCPCGICHLGVLPRKVSLNKMGYFDQNACAGYWLCTLHCHPELRTSKCAGHVCETVCATLCALPHVQSVPLVDVSAPMLIYRRAQSARDHPNFDSPNPVRSEVRKWCTFDISPSH